MRVVLVGAGRLATQLGLALHNSGHDILCVYSRTMSSAQLLADKTDSLPVDCIDAVPREADIFIIAVKDAVLGSVIDSLVQGRDSQLMVHTAGSMTMSLFEGKASRFGVFYPMQSFSKERRVDFHDIPVFIEANNEQNLQALRTLAESISHEVFHLSSEDRKYLHLAAVFACNFANHCYALAAQILEEHSLPFKVMLPLIDETARKVHQLHPREAQTGPAVRYDANILEKHTQLLAAHADMQDIYQLLSKSIHQKATEK